jgi:hypothetical protein
MNEKYGWDSQGPFTIRYGPQGVKWNRSWPKDTPSPPGYANSGGAVGLPYIEAATRAVEAVASLGQWYEMHQFRKLSEAQHEERRNQWLAEYIQLFVEHLARNSELDAKVSYYLSRETERLFNALFDNQKADVPGTLMYTCSVVQRYLADFNKNSSYCLRSAFAAEGKFNPTATFNLQDQLRNEFQRHNIGLEPAHLSDEDWLTYRPAEESFQELIALAEAGKLESITWEDIAKSALLLSLFIPIPPVAGFSLAARVAIWTGLGAVKGGTATAALPHASKMIRHINEFFKGKPSERRARLLKDFADLVLLKLEADSTTRLLTAAGSLMLVTGVKQLVIASNPQVSLPDQDTAGERGKSKLLIDR